jgi:COP9 signalosome complex subunit 1
LKRYSRAREYCSTAAQTVENCFAIIRISHEINNMSHIASQVNKAQSMPEAQENPATMAKLNASLAITKLETNKYKQVAQLMTDIDFVAFTNAHYEDVIAANDIAIYGGLCALATFNRRDIKSKVLDSPNFRQYLELEPQIRELILAFYYADYEKCMTLMEQWRVSIIIIITVNNGCKLIYIYYRMIFY